MRLLNTSSIKLQEFTDGEAQPYAILSHTCGAEEVTLRDLEGNRAVADKNGYKKIKNCCSVAFAKGFEYIWVDTCCI
jgi:hypothetical protein